MRTFVAEALETMCVAVMTLRKHARQAPCAHSRPARATSIAVLLGPANAWVRVGSASLGGSRGGSQGEGGFDLLLRLRRCCEYGRASCLNPLIDDCRQA